MYEIDEFYKEDGYDIKDVLKSCIYNYYIKNKYHHIFNDNQIDILDSKINNE